MRVVEVFFRVCVSVALCITGAFCTADIEKFALKISRINFLDEKFRQTNFRDVTREVIVAAYIKLLRESGQNEDADEVSGILDSYPQVKDLFDTPNGAVISVCSFIDRSIHNHYFWEDTSDHIVITPQHSIADQIKEQIRNWVGYSDEANVELELNRSILAVSGHAVFDIGSQYRHVLGFADRELMEIPEKSYILLERKFGQTLTRDDRVGFMRGFINDLWHAEQMAMPHRL